MKHLVFFTEKVLENGGEGIIARKPESLYENGRSSDLLKFKVLHRDGGIKGSKAMRLLI